METKEKFKIFLVDDNPASADLHNRFLLQIGYQNISSFIDSASFLSAMPEIGCTGRGQLA
jgi:hypothetical protein